MPVAFDFLEKMVKLSLYPGGSAFRESFYLVEAYHRSVPKGGGKQGTVCPGEF
jgi:hypothetical protein